MWCHFMMKPLKDDDVMKVGSGLVELVPLKDTWEDLGETAVTISKPGEEPPHHATPLWHPDFGLPALMREHICVA